jgi:hypothetical protein
MKKLFSLAMMGCALFVMINNVIAQNLPAYLPSNGLVAWYPFNGNANDESGNGNDGMVYPQATLTVDRNNQLNSAFQFNGSTSSAIQSQSPINLTFSGLSASLFFNANNFLSASSGDQKMISGTGNIPFQFGYNNGGVTLEVYDINGSLTFVTLPYVFTSNTWNSIAFSVNLSGHIFIYVNGVANDMGVSPASLRVMQSGSFLIGMASSYSWPSPFSGKLDDIAIYNRALTPEEITALYTGTPVNNNNGGNTSANAVPPGIPYQAVVRNANGQVAANTAATTKFTLHQNTTDGAVEYQETHALTTNAQGLVSAVIGQGTAVQGTFASINWSNTTKFLQVEVDLGNGYVDLGTQQLMSSPFAIRAQSAASIENPSFPVFADNAAALAGGLTVGKIYRTATGDLKVVY